MKESIFLLLTVMPAGRVNMYISQRRGTPVELGYRRIGAFLPPDQEADEIMYLKEF